MKTRSLWASVPLTSGGPYGGGPYAAGDFLQPWYASPRTNGLGMNPASDDAGGGGTITSVTVVDNDARGAPLDLYVFNTYDWAGPGDNLPWAISDLSATLCLGLMQVTTYVRHGTGLIGFGILPYGPIPYTCGDAGKTLYLAIVTKAPVTYSNYPLDIRLGLYEDGNGASPP